MSNVIDFPDKEFKFTTYTKHGLDLGVSTKSGSIGISRLNINDIELFTPLGSLVVDRAELSEFLWIAATFLDSERRWAPDGDLVGCNYE